MQRPTLACGDRSKDRGAVKGSQTAARCDPHMGGDPPFGSGVCAEADSSGDRVQLGVRGPAQSPCKAHKTALRAFLDEIPSEELVGELRPRMAAWTSRWLVPCRMDGTLETPVSTGEVPVWAGPSPSAPLP
jgi:hypothetical protein